MTLTSKEKLTEILIHLKEIERLAPGTFTFFLHDIAEEDIPKAGFSIYKPNEEADYKVADLKNSTNHISFFTARERRDMTNEKYSITTAIIERTGTYYVVQATLIMDGCTFQAMGSRDGSPMGAEDSAVERVKTLAGIASSFMGTTDSKNEKKSSSDDDKDLDF